MGKDGKQHNTTISRLKFAQLNCNRSRAVHDLMLKNCKDECIDIMIGSELTNNTVNIGISDVNKDYFVKMYIDLEVETKFKGKDYIGHIFKATVIVSCHFSPNGAEDDFEELLENLSVQINRWTSTKKILIGGDLNAKTPVLGSAVANRRRLVLEDWISHTGIVVMNEGNVPTFCSVNGSSIIDVTLVNCGMVKALESWRVEENQKT
ncbi:uncharacterized protein [Euwallacea similis]|uniref:uncharacterized protein n=1 Tax=Euwallacea similis TaxID=1736056 RepID=UPI00344B0092